MNIKNFFLATALISSFNPVIGMMWMGSGQSSPNNVVANYRQKRINNYFKTLQKKVNKNYSIEEIEKWSSMETPEPLAYLLATFEKNDLLKKLLDKGLSSQTNTDQKYSPIREAISSGNDVAAQLLLKHGALITELNTEGNTLLMETISRLFEPERTWSRIIDYRFDVINTLHKILEHKESNRLINCKNNEGQTALGLAICGLSEAISIETKQSIEIVDLLLKHGENPFLATKNEPTSKAIQKIENDKRYKTLIDHLYTHHQKFKERSVANLASRLIQNGPQKGRKNDESLTYGPFTKELAVEIAQYRFNCGVSDFDSLNKRLEARE